MSGPQVLAAGEAITLTRATEADVATLVALYEEASRWLMARGLRQWPPGWYTTAMALDSLRAGHEMYLARRDGEPVGKLTLQWDDPEMWGKQAPDAGYVHGLCVSRAAAGLGLGAALLDWAGQQVAARSPLAAARLHGGQSCAARLLRAAGLRLSRRSRRRLGRALRAGPHPLTPSPTGRGGNIACSPLPVGEGLGVRF